MAEAVCDLIVESELDSLVLTEMWLSANEEENNAVISGPMLSSHGILHVPKKTRGDGVGFIYNK